MLAHISRRTLTRSIHNGPVFSRSTIASPSISTFRYIHSSNRLLAADKDDASKSNSETEKTPSSKDTKPSLAESYLDMSHHLPTGSQSSSEAAAAAAEEEEAARAKEGAEGSKQSGSGGFPGERTGAKSRSDSRPLTSFQKKRRLYSRIFMGSSVIAALIGSWWMGRDWETEREQNVLSKQVDTEASAVVAHYQRAMARFWDILDYFNKPAWDPLLPPMLAPPYSRPYTLVIELDDVLVHSQWDRKHGWRTAKRPGADYFLGYLSQFYEIVIFTHLPSYTAEQIIMKLDPLRAHIMYTLFRESTRYKNGDHIKDLSYLGRNPGKVIVIDKDSAAVQLDPDNGVILPPWDGNRKDTDLVGLIPFLEAIGAQQIADVRPIIHKYRGKHVPTEYAKVEAEYKQKIVDAWKEKERIKKERGGEWFGSLNFSSLFGVSESNANEPPKTAVEIARERAQKAYMEEQKYLKEHEHEIKKYMEEQMGQVDTRGSLMSLLSGQNLPKQPEPEDQGQTSQQQQPK